MNPNGILVVGGVSAAISVITAILARDQLVDAKLKEEVGLTDLVGRDPRRLPNRLFTPKGVRMKRTSIACGIAAMVAFVVYSVLR
jgi:hypothetical protein